jgi:hypothetical protein
MGASMHGRKDSQAAVLQQVPISLPAIQVGLDL